MLSAVSPILGFLSSNTHPPPSSYPYHCYCNIAVAVKTIADYKGVVIAFMVMTVTSFRRAMVK
jgi:hypothetical protein